MDAEISQAHAECREAYDKLLKAISNSDTKEQIEDYFSEAIKKGADFANVIDRSVKQINNLTIPPAEEVIKSKVEDCIDFLHDSISHWDLIEKVCNKYGFVSPKPNASAYSTIQRFIHTHKPNETNKLRKALMNAKLPTKGFDDNSRSGWKIGQKKITALQIIIGVLLLIVAGLLIFMKENMNGTQYYFSRGIFSLGLTLVGTALLEGTLKVNWSLGKAITIKAVGWVSLLIIFYLINPPPPPSMH